MTERVDITYGVVTNQREGHGFLPFVAVNGRQQRSPWAAVGYSRSEAETRAKTLADEESERWIGDWEITVMAA